LCTTLDAIAPLFASNSPQTKVINAPITAQVGYSLKKALTADCLSKSLTSSYSDI